MIEAEPRGHIKNFIYEQADLEKLTTRQLISFIRHIGTWHRMYFGDWTYDDCYEHRYKEYIDKYVCVREIWPDNYPTAYYWADEDVLRDILKTRPNIPNKIQNIQKRKAMIAANRRKVKHNLKYNR